MKTRKKFFLITAIDCHSMIKIINVINHFKFYFCTNISKSQIKNCFYDKVPKKVCKLKLEYFKTLLINNLLLKYFG